MRVALLTLSFIVLALPAFARGQPKEVHDSAPLRYGMDQAEAEKVIGDAAMWRIAYRVDTETTAEIACVWSGSVFYHVRFLSGKCCYIEKRAEVDPEGVDQLIQMYRAVYGDSPEATQNKNATLIFSRWQLPQREITISAVGHNGKYKLFYEEFDPVQVGDVRVAQEKELGAEAETDPLTGKLRISPLGQAATTEPGTDDAKQGDDTSATGDSAQTADDEGDSDAQPQPDDKPKKDKRKRAKPDPVTGDGG